MIDKNKKQNIEKPKLEIVLVTAHQLKTPLSALKWIFKMFLEGDAGSLTPEQLDLIKKGDEANEGMIVLVNDLLNAGRLEKKKPLYDFQRHNFPDLIKSVTSENSVAIKRKEINIEFKLLPKEIWLVCDASTVKMLLSNLIGNAIHYSSDGGKIAISVKEVGNFAEFSVADGGIGIPKCQQKEIFSKFFRGDNVLRLQKTGSGLGLYVAKKIVKDHGGKIWFESEENKGSKFYFTLPLKRK